MQTLTSIARILLGLIFVTFGANGFLHFLPQPPVPSAAQAFFGALAATGYLLPLLFLTEITAGALLLVGVVPLALVLLAPVIVNIVGFHVFLAPGGLPLAAVVAALEVFLAWTRREAFAPLFGAGS